MTIMIKAWRGMRLLCWGTMQAVFYFSVKGVRLGGMGDNDGSSGHLRKSHVSRGIFY